MENYGIDGAIWAQLPFSIAYFAKVMRGEDGKQSGTLSNPSKLYLLPDRLKLVGTFTIQLLTGEISFHL